MQIETTRFGRIDVAEEALIHFPDGLYGLEKLRRYCLIPHDPEGRFFWLQAADAPEVAMVVTDPFAFVPGYEAEISTPASETLKASEPADVEVFTTVRVAPDGEGLYLNLLGPLVVNRAAGVGLQIIQDAKRYSARHLYNGAASAEQAA